ncbi:hypothetical protein [Acidocella sp.]|uniref:hypothetical protein n=1 Tax=Acidocella sp. TaxID=50710 RepID=UPI00184E27C1|nr:hypothetical protein [Acidocella sp.]NNM55620.1 hypothetical protein [Acidocella sp.]
MIIPRAAWEAVQEQPAERASRKTAAITGHKSLAMVSRYTERNRCGLLSFTHNFW